jgi:hypothetical protein
VLGLSDFEATEQRMRGLLADAELPAPDRVEYWEVSVAFFWDESKACVVVELMDHPGFDGPKAPP